MCAECKMSDTVVWKKRRKEPKECTNEHQGMSVDGIDREGGHLLGTPRYIFSTSRGQGLKGNEP